ncbi:DUF2161 domain-containing phosphodiesterase [Psychromonas sp. Urea-02u-13]|uniref:DUF2161 domain-containing phosphodiesterase n=1 Tax=Psychromonas sp. Urea-02u-13 TaxID=2058326 RepID=UPI000C34D1CA|nr:DUF2161 family putative PD-(D/E)XK-type phosphodiesterase [Psychromonas sp. Urea-02u-13]PKG40154.1 hypothetical protein CXF74_04900 [Psychromonas sp. Urea-02u-13]
MPNKLQESDLYLPIKDHLEKLGFEVKGEIKDCDIVAQKDDQLIIIELKLNLNITLLLQAVDRFSLSDIVYIAIPKQCSLYKKQSKQVKKLIKRLGIGLMIVDIQKTAQYVEVVFDPQDYTPRTNKRKQGALLKEFSLRIGDTQKGGSTRAKAGLTAYRQRCIRVAEYLVDKPSAKGAEIKKKIGEEQATSFLSKDYYGWFEKVDRGVYQLSKKGKQELPEWSVKLASISI